MFDDKCIVPARFDTEDIDFDNPLFLEGASDYLPLIALLGKGLKDVVPFYYLKEYASGRENVRNESFAKAVDNHKGLQMLFRRVSTRYGNGSYNRVQMASIIKSSIDRYLQSTHDMSLELETEGYVRTSYDRIATSFFKTKQFTYYLQSMKVIVSGAGSIFRGFDKSLIMSLVVKKELLKYQKLHLITEGNFDYSAMEFWINCDIDTSGYRFKAFRKMYRTHIKPRLMELGVPIIEKGDVDASLTASFEVPQTTIAALEEWKSKLLSEFLKKEADNLTFQFS